MWLFATKWGRKFSTPRKIAIGMGIAAIAYLFMTVFCKSAGYPSAADFTNPEITTAADAAAAKAGISPLGLSFVSKVAPKNLLGLCQGLWLGATAVGNGLLWIGPLMYTKFPIWICWSVFMGVCLLSMIVMLCMVKWLERVTQ